MIEKIKKYEAMYLKTLKERFSLLDHSQLLEKKLNEIEEVFRNPNLLIESIKEMQSKQEESLRDIQIKLDEMNEIKDNLKSGNAFRSNLSLFNQKEETPLFGSIKLDGCW